MFIKVQEGDYFAAGGWNGQVKRISHENGDSTLTNRTFEDGRTSVGRCGWGVSAYAMCVIISTVITLLLFILFYFILSYDFIILNSSLVLHLIIYHLSYPILSYPILSYPILSYPILSYLFFLSSNFFLLETREQDHITKCNHDVLQNKLK